MFKIKKKKEKKKKKKKREYRGLKMKESSNTGSDLIDQYFDGREHTNSPGS